MELDDVTLDFPIAINRIVKRIQKGAVAEIDNAPEQPEEDFPMPEPVVEPEVPQEINVSDGIIPAKTAKKRGRRKTG